MLRRNTENAFQNLILLYLFLLEVNHKKRHSVWLQGTVSNKLNDKDIKGIVVNLRDVTEKINANRKLEKFN
ncbi:hypothetical protein [Flavobacterium sp.]|uniref:hypothetical protein n=1 Tax=Flavobacterium sp. TaxID=239 RepID=UPI003C41407F